MKCHLFTSYLPIPIPIFIYNDHQLPIFPPRLLRMHVFMSARVCASVRLCDVVHASYKCQMPNLHPHACWSYF